MEHQITLKLPIAVVEYLLGLVDQQPRKVANPIFSLIEGQARAQVDEINAQAAATQATPGEA